MRRGSFTRSVACQKRTHPARGLPCLGARKTHMQVSGVSPGMEHQRSEAPGNAIEHGAEPVRVLTLGSRVIPQRSLQGLIDDDQLHVRVGDQRANECPRAREVQGGRRHAAKLSTWAREVVAHIRVTTGLMTDVRARAGRHAARSSDRRRAEHRPANGRPPRPGNAGDRPPSPGFPRRGLGRRADGGDPRASALH